MITSKSGLRFVIFASLLLAATSAARGQMYLFLAIDPPTTAGAGIPVSGGFTVTSFRSGAGSFHLYASDDVAGSYGIATYNIKLIGTFTALNNRSSDSDWFDLDGFSYSEGFSDLRTSSG